MAEHAVAQTNCTLGDTQQLSQRGVAYQQTWLREITSRAAEAARRASEATSQQTILVQRDVNSNSNSTRKIFDAQRMESPDQFDARRQQLAAWEFQCTVGSESW